jgi:hypothetical protein
MEVAVMEMEPAHQILMNEHHFGPSFASSGHSISLCLQRTTLMLSFSGRLNPSCWMIEVQLRGVLKRHVRFSSLHGFKTTLLSNEGNHIG